MFAGKRILLIIGGGIAAYKSLELIRGLKKRGARVRVVLTRAAREFVTPLSAASLSGEKVHDDLFDLVDETEMGHINLSRISDLVVVAPATADLMAKLANGLANDLASTLLLATDTPVLMAPAMNLRMWEHAATRRNVKTLARDGITFIGPAEGDMACGEYGPGRMAEPPEIVEAIGKALLAEAADQPLRGRRILVTSGPTREPIDPVRYISNHSSGKQGAAIAEALARRGAHVVFITGPGALQPDHEGIQILPVNTARDMLAAVNGALPADAAIFVAAVADWRVEEVAGDKIKKDASAKTLKLVENPDILARISQLEAEKRPSLVIGFAAETGDLLANAAAKRIRKGCDWILANDVSQPGVMGGDENQIHLIDENGTSSWPRMSKAQLAEKLADAIDRALSSKEEGP
ncbi:MAG TPA: bifunctional phosphopantothenoylcysteine decarboxylase/phosphopantothenate--cysteine ligase CoaBC [Rhizobiales bacterium]|nr:bifunctional phosphopantothenoylcysteine decarboxylase/phosphopantothenate--cysteine ligase CoaBC [Hyphomicrobiales bacterium]